MLILKARDYDFVGFNSESGLYDFVRKNVSIIEKLSISEGKFVKAPELVLYLKPGGDVEVTRSSRRKMRVN